MLLQFKTCAFTFSALTFDQTNENISLDQESDL